MSSTVPLAVPSVGGMSLVVRVAVAPSAVSTATSGEGESARVAAADAVGIVSCVVIGCGWRHLREVGGRAAASTSSSMGIGFGGTPSHIRGGGSGVAGSLPAYVRKYADVRRPKRNGGGGSGIRRGAFGSIHVHIRGAGGGQRLGGG